MFHYLWTYGRFLRCIPTGMRKTDNAMRAKLNRISS
jgi:hypothetical protein